MSLIEKYNIDLTKYLPKKVYNFYEPFSFTPVIFSTLNFEKGVTYFHKTQTKVNTFVKSIKYYPTFLKNIIKEIRTKKLNENKIEPLKDLTFLKTNRQLILEEDIDKVIELSFSFERCYDTWTLKEINDLIDEYHTIFKKTLFYRNITKVFDELEMDNKFLEKMSDSLILIQLERERYNKLEQTYQLKIIDYLNFLKTTTINYIIISDFKLGNLQELPKKLEFAPHLFFYHNLQTDIYFDFPSDLISEEDEQTEEKQEVIHYENPDDDQYYDPNIPDESDENLDDSNFDNEPQSFFESHYQQDETPIATYQNFEPPVKHNEASLKAIEQAKQDLLEHQKKQTPYKNPADEFYRKKFPAIQEQIELGNHVKARDKLLTEVTNTDNPVYNLNDDDWSDDDFEDWGDL